jgi:hypothetical protein
MEVPGDHRGMGATVVRRVNRRNGRWVSVTVSWQAGCIPCPEYPGQPQEEWRVPMGSSIIPREQWEALLDAQPPRDLPSEALTLADVPSPDAPLRQIFRFALTWDGYERAGSSDACARVANARRNGTLDDLRTCLFFEQRRFRHFGTAPEGEDLAYVRGLVRQIRDRLAERGGRSP